MPPANPTTTSSDDDYSICPIPATHRRLAESHILWHQALESYGQPERFRANLNATIQALRNVTFALQSEKGGITGFDEWYEPWQARLAADPVSTWVKQSRNLVVKQGDLQTISVAVVRLLTWKDDVLAEADAPPETPSALLLANIDLLKLVSTSKVPPGDATAAAVAIERRWSVSELAGREILESLASAYGLLSKLVLDAHLHIRQAGCIATRPQRPHFVTRHHRTGALDCMAAAQESRTERFSIAGEPMVGESRPVKPVARPSDASARYGLRLDDRIPDWETSDPVLLAERLVFQAKRILRRDRSHIRLMLIRDGSSRWHQFVLFARDRTEKHILIRMIAFVQRWGLMQSLTWEKCGRSASQTCPELS
jgi:hypothetical protein